MRIFLSWAFWWSGNGDENKCFPESNIGNLNIKLVCEVYCVRVWDHFRCCIYFADLAAPAAPFLFPIGLIHEVDFACPSFNIFAASDGIPGSMEFRFRLTPVSGRCWGVSTCPTVLERKSHLGWVTDAGVFRERRTLPVISGVLITVSNEAFDAKSDRLVLVTAWESTVDDFLAELIAEDLKCRPEGVARPVTVLAWEGWFSESLL